MRGASAWRTRFSADFLVTAGRDAVIARLVPLEGLLTDLPSVLLTADDAGRARRGMDLPAPDTWAAVPDLARLLDDRGCLVGLATPSTRPRFLHPSVVLG